MIILGFLVALIAFAVAATRFGYDSRIEAWSNELRRRWDLAA